MVAQDIVATQVQGRSHAGRVVVQSTDFGIETIEFEDGTVVWGEDELDLRVETHIREKGQRIEINAETQEPVLLSKAHELQTACFLAFMLSPKGGWNLYHEDGRPIDRSIKNVCNPRIIDKKKREKITDTAMRLYFPENYDKTPAEVDEVKEGKVNEADELDNPFSALGGTQESV